MSRKDKGLQIETQEQPISDMESQVAILNRQLDEARRKVQAAKELEAARKQEADRDRVLYWPKDQTMPDAYRKVQRYPCPACRRLRTDDLTLVADMYALAKGKAYFRCKACGNRWSLAVIMHK